MRIEEQFSRYAKSYLKYSIIQQKGAEILAEKLPSNLGAIADLGCGNGRLYKELQKRDKEFDKFYGADFSKEMINMHPNGQNIELITGDFNNRLLFEKLKKLNLNYLLSASALQWAKDLDFTLKSCSKVALNAGFFIFTSGTFKSLHKFVNIESPIYSKERVLDSFNRYYRSINVKEYNFKLQFNDNLEMLRYIKKSGVSGGRVHLGYKDLKALIDNYPQSYLEFETVLLIGEAK